MPKFSYMVALFAIGVSATFAQQSNPSNANVQDAVASLVMSHNNWGPQASTPNVSLVIKESARSGKIIKLRLYAEGVPKDGIYSIVAWPVTTKGPSVTQQGVTLAADGLAICAGTPGTCRGDRPDDPVDLVVQPIPGEPVRLGLVSADGSVRALAKTVPVPLKGEDHGCTVEAVLLTPGAELVWLEGSGFSPGSELTVDSNSEGERQNKKVKADGQGRYTTAMLPYKQGLRSGTLKVNLKSAGCSPTVTVPWGRRN